MPYYGEIIALVTASCWSFSAFIFTKISIKLGPIQVNADRLVLAGLFLGIITFFGGFNLDISLRQLILLVSSGIIGLFIADSFLFRAFRDTGPRISMLIMSFNPAIATILAFTFLGEVLSLFSIMGICITLGGIAVVILGKDYRSNKSYLNKRQGIISAFIAAAGQGTGIVLAKEAFNEGDIHAIPATFIRIAASAILLLPLSIILKKYTSPMKAYIESPINLFNLMLATLLGPFIGVTLSYEAATNAPIGVAATIMSLVPVIMLPLSVIIEKEKLTFTAVAGAFIAVIGIAILFLF